MNDMCLYIKVKNEYNNYIYKLLKGIGFEDYCWKVLYSDVFCSDTKQEILFQKDILESTEINTMLEYKNYYIIELDIKCYKKGDVYNEIKTIDDFMESKCVFMFLLYDCSFVHLYFKDTKMMDIVYNNCIEMGAEVKREKINKTSIVSSFS